MDQKINDYLESLVSKTLSAPAFAGLPEEQHSIRAEKIRSHLYNTIFDMVIDRLSNEQLSEIKDLPFSSPEMINKIQEFAAFMPNLAQELEARLDNEVSAIVQNPQILDQDG